MGEYLPDVFERQADRPGLYVLEPSDDNLSPGIVVAKRVGYSRQVLIGPREMIGLMDEAMTVLDEIYPRRLHREMNVVVGARVNEETDEYEIDKNGLLFSRELLRRFGVGDPYVESNFLFPEEANEPVIGIFSDMIRPIFFSPDNSYFFNAGASAGTVAVYWAAQIAHEQEHVDHLRGGINSTSLWEERRAIMVEARTIEEVLVRRPGTREENEWLADFANYCRRVVFDYRQGRGFEKHMEGMEIENNPLGSESTISEEVI